MLYMKKHMSQRDCGHTIIRITVLTKLDIKILNTFYKISDATQHIIETRKKVVNI